VAALTSTHQGPANGRALAGGVGARRGAQRSTSWMSARERRGRRGDPLERGAAPAAPRWRDPDSNRGHHDFQKARKTRLTVPICRTSTGRGSDRSVITLQGWYRRGRPVPVGRAFQRSARRPGVGAGAYATRTRELPVRVRLAPFRESEVPKAKPGPAKRGRGRPYSERVLPAAESAPAVCRCTRQQGALDFRLTVSP
jgi:hypothetical protein